MDIIDTTVSSPIDWMNNDKIFWGITMILLNIGSKYVVADMGKIQEKLLSSIMFKKVITFSMFFVATRDIVVSALLTLSYILYMDVLLNDQSKYTLFQSMSRNMHAG